MDRRFTELALLAATALFAFTAASAQNADPTLPEDAADEQTMVPEDADEDGELVPADADDDTTAEDTTASVTTTPGAAPLRQAAAPAAAAGADTPLNVIITGAQQAASTEALRNGCWVRLYEAANFSGNSVTLLGPVDVAQPDGPFGMEWEDDVGSIEVGPAAAVSVFSDDDFEGTETRFAAGRRASAAADEVESLRITCAGAG